MLNYTVQICMVCQQYQFASAVLKSFVRLLCCTVYVCVVSHLYEFGNVTINNKDLRIVWYNFCIYRVYHQSMNF